MNNKNTDGRLSEKMARSVMGRYRPENFLWHYEHGLMIQSIYHLGKHLGNAEYTDWARMMIDTKIRDDGSIVSYREGDFNLDQINPGKLLFDLFKDTGETRYRKAVEILHNQLINQPRTESGGFWHKKIYPHQMWLDGLYMQGPFTARYALEFGTAGELNDVVHQLVLMESRTRDARTGLLYHAWDESRKQLWANPKTGCSPHFWGRAMGWYCMALADVLELIPDTAGHSGQRSSLGEIAARLAETVIRYQDQDSSLWYQILDQGNRERNYLETSASSMFVYFLYKLVRNGILTGQPAETARGAAKAGYSSLVKKMLREEPSGELHLAGICSVAGLGGDPYRDGSFDYYVKEPVVEDDFKGAGPFILASMESEQA